MNRVKSALKLSSLTPESKVTRAQGILDAMQASGNFPNNQMPIAYNALQTLIDNLHNAIIATNTGSTNSTANMHEQERILLSAYNLVKAHVEYVANTSTSPETIITSAGLTVAVPGGQNAVSTLTLDAAGNGSVTVRVPRVAAEKAFVYEVSADGVTYTRFTSSSLTKVTITGQQPGSTIYVRYYAISKNGEGAISQPKSVIVT